MCSKRDTERAEYAPGENSAAFRDVRRHTAKGQVHCRRDSIAAQKESAGQWQSRRRRSPGAGPKWCQTSATTLAPSCPRARASATALTAPSHVCRHCVKQVNHSFKFGKKVNYSA